MRPRSELIHLTELRLTPSGRGLLADTQKTHRTIMWAVGGESRVLWAAPRRDLIVVQADRPVRSADFDGVVRESHSSLKPLDVTGGVSLSLIAHPTYSKDGRVQVLPLEKWEGWFRRKLDGAVTVNEVTAQDLGPRTGNRHGKRVTHRWVGFSATGTVTDPAALRKLLVEGVGRGKAYGCGMLLAVPA